MGFLEDYEHHVTPGALYVKYPEHFASLKEFIHHNDTNKTTIDAMVQLVVIRLKSEDVSGVFEFTPKNIPPELEPVAAPIRAKIERYQRWSLTVERVKVTVEKGVISGIGIQTPDDDALARELLEKHYDNLVAYYGHRGEVFLSHSGGTPLHFSNDRQAKVYKALYRKQYGDPNKGCSRQLIYLKPLVEC
jgi:hypothetical protein